MTNTQGEFPPRQPRFEESETGGQQASQKTSSNDNVSEFAAKTPSPWTAPKESTHQPNRVREVPRKALGDNVDRSHGRIHVGMDPLSRLLGATPKDVHTGLGHPGYGQTSMALRTERKHTSSKATSGPEGGGASGGSRQQHPEDRNREVRRLQHDRSHHKSPIKEHNQSLAGAEEKKPESAQFVAAEGRE